MLLNAFIDSQDIQHPKGSGWCSNRWANVTAPESFFKTWTPEPNTGQRRNVDWPPEWIPELKIWFNQSKKRGFLFIQLSDFDSNRGLNGWMRKKEVRGRLSGIAIRRIGPECFSIKTWIIDSWLTNTVTYITANVTVRNRQNWRIVITWVRMGLASLVPSLAQKPSAIERENWWKPKHLRSPALMAKIPMKLFKDGPTQNSLSFIFIF